MKNLKKLAKDFVEGHIFISNEPEIVQRHFLVLSFMNPEDMPQDVAAVYEYYSEAGPLSLNGLPMFFSCSFLSSIELKEFRMLADQYKQIAESWS